MGYITIGMIALTIIAVLFGTLFGMGRGRNRAILRLILVIASIVGAFLLRETVTEIIMGIDTGDGTLAETLTKSMSEGEDKMPVAMQNLMLAMVQISFSFIAYLITFIALRFVSWLIIFPICKIFVKKGIKKRRGAGALIGFVQGLVIAFATLVPLNGLAGEMGKISTVKVDGQSMMGIPAEVGIDDYINSPTYKIFNTAGGWYYEMLTTAKTEDGEKITLGDTFDVFSAMLEFASSMEKVDPAMDTIKNETTAQEKFDAFTQASIALDNASKKVNALKPATRKMLNDIIVSMSSEGEGTQEITLEYLNFGGASDFFEGFATYVNKTEIDTSEPVSQEDVNLMINGLASSDFLLEGFVGDGNGIYTTVYQVESQHVSWFATAINTNTNLTNSQKTALSSVFGLN